VNEDGGVAAAAVADGGTALTLLFADANLQWRCCNVNGGRREREECAGLERRSRWCSLQSCKRCDQRGAVVLMVAAVTGASPAMMGHGGRKRRRLPWRLMMAARV